MYPIIRILGCSFPTFSVIGLVAFSVCIGLYVGKNINKSSGEIVWFLKFITIVLLFAAIGARLLSAVSLWLQGKGTFVFCFFHGGAVFYGGLAGGILALIFLCGGNVKRLLNTADTIVIYLPLGQSIGRIGCFFNGCCYGCAYSGILSVKYPVDGDYVSVFPTWFVESGFCIILFILFSLRKRGRVIGYNTGMYLFSYAAFRFGLEFFRGDNIRGYWGAFSTSQLISPIFMAIGICLLLSGLNKTMNSTSIPEE